MKLLWLSLVIISVLVISDVTPVIACPGRCTCDNTTVMCGAVSTFPTNIPTSTVELHIYGLYSEIPPNAFHGLSNLEILSVSGLRNLPIRSRTFFRLNQLRELKFFQNDITYFETGGFSDLERISKINFFQNTINHFSEGAFQNITGLPRNGISMFQNTFGEFMPRTIEPLLAQGQIEFYQNEFNCTCAVKWMLTSKELQSILGRNRCLNSGQSMDMLTVTSLGPCTDTSTSSMSRPTSETSTAATTLERDVETPSSGCDHMSVVVPVITTLFAYLALTA